MTDVLHPSLLLFFGAAVVPLLRGRAQQAWMLLVPAVVIAAVYSLSHGTAGAMSLFGMDLVIMRTDDLSLVFAYVFAIITLVGALYALHIKDTTQHVAALVYAGSSLGVVLAGDLITLYVFWEMMVFSSVWLIWCRRNPASMAAGFRYLLVHALGGVVLLGGVILHVLDTGSIAFEAFSADSAGFYLILIGFMVNAAVPPLHAWLADAYPEATVTGAIFLSALTTKTAVYTLIRGFPGTELLVILGVTMSLYGVVYAVLANDIRRLLAYHIISQVGYMVAGVGMGSIMALNGSAAHAFTHILYKALLFMGAGAVIHMTGRAKVTELGGLYRYMPITLVMYMIGGLSISAFPPLSGFVSKTMVVEAAALDQRAWVWLLLSLTSAGTFLSAGLKLPWLTFFGKDSGLRPEEAPWNMLLAMGIAAFLCIFIGIFPGTLYAIMPAPVEFNAYSVGHVLWELQLLMFAGLGFFMLLKRLEGANKISLDVDWLYRKLLPRLATRAQKLVDQVWGGMLAALMGRLRWLVTTVNRHHGPQGVLARTWPTGSMVLWVAVMLAASLLVYYF
ncbi:MAG: Na(+)/H(+) antiporter subunit D [Gammaproteobacteria bacterium]|nr:MAG: Na(+)/H(+) antiporter subunit D [Gammaproteobacteria bacterium]